MCAKKEAIISKAGEISILEKDPEHNDPEQKKSMIIIQKRKEIQLKRDIARKKNQ